ncbi:MAG: efflux RND transporter permease subunit [Proteobacteria bacterium]|nr:efflux RND transporter permease subunit [Pseudomonadota bacterium]MBU1451225.1 efflux RND transporter permease subunit [Pseudomonadota bacterium]MBU2470124.1 efflux RND transporter permease subunit [Pseudomonadota bacterium]MBU2516376.1 efflux RND transporter permease subunit [Pseudomonadota bacterium]
MKLVSTAIAHPVSVSVGVILLVMFGLLALFAVPVQLIPDVDRPMITVRTTWLGASPQEIEQEIIQRQEKELKSVEGLVRMTSESVTSQGTITLEFPVGTDVDTALVRVNNKLQQVPRYPANADKPVLISASENAPPIAWMVVVKKRPEAENVEEQRTFVRERVLPLIERVQGVASATLYGGVETEMQVVLDPRKVAAHSLTMQQIRGALVAENVNISGGGLDEGRRRYQVRTQSQFENPGQIDNAVVAYEDGAPVMVRDLGNARLGYARPDSVVLQFGQPSLVFNAVRETGTNVLEVMAGLQKAVANVNRELLDEVGLEIHQAYDETDYIRQAIDLVRDNIYIGGGLAITVLLIFLRSISATFIVAIAIPISLIGTFIMMSAFGRNINVISLAGLAFSAGMVVDNSIVVLENIYRLRQAGKSRMEAAYEGTVQVWGAVLASTLTTVAVFLPVIRVKQEAGQLFADIAIAVSFAVLLSMAVSITVIPTLAARIVGGGEGKGQGARRQDRWLRPLLVLGEGVRGFISGTVFRITGSVTARLGLVLLMTALALSMAWFLAPKAEYLPTGNRNLVLGILLPPPGYNIKELTRIGHKLTKDWQAHWGPNYHVEAGNKAEPSVKTFFYVGWGAQVFMGLATWDDQRARELIPLMRRTLATIPGMIPIVQQTSLFQRGAAQGRTIDLDLTGPDLGRLVRLGGRLFGQIQGLIPGVQIRPIPGLDLGQPELRFVPDRVRAAAVGLNASAIGFNLNVLVEGAKIDEVRREGYNIDLKLMALPASVGETQDLGRMQINTPDGRLVTLAAVAPPRLMGGPTQINHIERQRAVTLRIYPPEDVALQEAMERLEQKVVQPLVASGQVAPPYGIGLSGTADDLTQTRQALQGNFLLALAITFLLMAALFESFLYPFVIMFSVPLAAAGGFLGLWVVNATLSRQPLDVLTMLGFIILIGIVVNNAILIVHRTLQGMRDDNLEPREAVTEAVRLRTRPIFMSALTSVFAMLPLVLFPGAGSELYRGLGSVVVGGLLVSTIFTLFLVPSLLSLVLDARRKVAQWRGRPFKA